MSPTPTERLISLWDHLGIGSGACRHADARRHCGARDRLRFPACRHRVVRADAARSDELQCRIRPRADDLRRRWTDGRCNQACRGATARFAARRAGRLRRAGLGGRRGRPHRRDRARDDRLPRQAEGRRSRPCVARRRACRHHLAHRGHGPGADPAAVLSRAVAMGAGGRALGASTSPSSRWAARIWAASRRSRIAPARRPTRRCSAP